MTAAPRSAGRTGGYREPRTRWVLLLLVILTVVSTFLVHGYVYGDLGHWKGDQGSHVQGPYDQVPEQVIEGGPVIDTRQDPPRTLVPPAKTVVLTFDDGPNATWTPKVLDVLRRHQVQATFSVPSAHTRATGAQHWRGLALIWTTHMADWAVRALPVLFTVAGTLMIVRLLLMIAVALRHSRRRRRPWPGNPVSAPVSVVVPAFNEKEGIAAPVCSIAVSDYPKLEVVVVDDGSTDGTADIIEALGLPNVRVIRKPNEGKASALNTGIAAASHDLLVLVDGDTVFESDTVRKLVQPFCDSRIGGVSGNAKVGNRKGLLGRWQHIDYVIGFNLDRRCYDAFECMPTVPGAIGAFRREALREVKGVSDDTLAEDTDLTMSLIRTGWKVVYQEYARAWTEAPHSMAQLWKQRYRWCYGTLQAMWKHRRVVIERGPAGHLGRRGLVLLLLFQLLLPLMAPAMDAFLLYGVIFLDPVRTALLWSAVLVIQLLSAMIAFRMDRERLRVLWALPFQQLVSRQLMYLVVIQSVITVLFGACMRWHTLRRTAWRCRLGLGRASEHRRWLVIRLTAGLRVLPYVRWRAAADSYEPVPGVGSEE
jgi:cellulose synthase/poly-beta-1,6-N-acetylglucosamine synthase-like glycosyltransferase